MMLGPGERVTLSTESSTTGDTRLYRGSGGAVWNNDGDTIIVTTDDGDAVLRYEY